MRKIGIAPTHGTELEHIRKKEGMMGCLWVAYLY